MQKPELIRAVLALLSQHASKTFRVSYGSFNFLTAPDIEMLYRFLISKPPRLAARFLRPTTPGGRGASSHEYKSEMTLYLNQWRIPEQLNVRLKRYSATLLEALANFLQANS